MKVNFKICGKRKALLTAVILMLSIIISLRETDVQAGAFGEPKRENISARDFITEVFGK